MITFLVVLSLVVLAVLSLIAWIITWAITRSSTPHTDSSDAPEGAVDPDMGEMDSISTDDESDATASTATPTQAPRVSVRHQRKADKIARSGGLHLARNQKYRSDLSEKLNENVQDNVADSSSEHEPTMDESFSMVENTVEESSPHARWSSSCFGLGVIISLR